MKKLLFLIAVGMFLLPEISFAKLDNALTTDPIGYIMQNRIGLKYEKMLKRSSSFTAEVLYDNTCNNTNGFGIGASYRRYFRTIIPVKTAGVEGFSIGPYAKAIWLNTDDKVNKSKNEAGFDIGAEIAYKVILWQNFAVEPIIRANIGFGPAAYSNKDGFNVWPGIAIGFAW